MSKTIEERAKELAEFNDYLTDARNSFVKAITEVYPHEDRLDDYARSIIRVASEDILIAFDQLREKFAGATEGEGWTSVEDGLYSEIEVETCMLIMARYIVDFFKNPNPDLDTAKECDRILEMLRNRKLPSPPVNDNR